MRKNNMSMRDAIQSFPDQFSYNPEIVNAQNLKRRDIFIVAGMGGSHLAGDILQAWDPSLDVIVHSDYGISGYPASVLDKALLIASSYSGNTEETISAFEEARERGMTVMAISVGGKLIEIAKKHALPYIKLPDIGIQPRSALGFSFLALLKATGNEKALLELRGLATSLDPTLYESKGKGIAKRLHGKVPVIYSSRANYAIAYTWKIKFNETGKIPAFMNVFPELNHNEMNGFDVKELTRKLAENFCFLFLEDGEDDSRIQRRMKITKLLFEQRGLKVLSAPLEGRSRLERIFSSVLLVDWAAFHSAGLYNVDPEQVPMVEELKGLMA